MKRLFLLCFLAFISLSCEEIQDFIDPKGHGLVFLEGEMKAYFDDKGDTKNYKFKADLAWSAEVSADWVEVDPTSGPAGENKIKIKVDKNKSDEKRTGYVDITLSNDKSYRIELEQMAAGESLDDVTPSISIPNNEIWYTSSDGNIVEPCSDEDLDDVNILSVFGANIISNAYDAEKECWVIMFDGDVTTIGYGAFYGCDSLTSVTIPNSVTIIGEGAFACCYELTSATIGDSVTSIGDYAFAECDSLTNVNIPNSVTKIGEGAFHECHSFTSVIIPDGVTVIEMGAFFWCTNITSVTIGNSVTTIEMGAFSGCHNLQEFNGKFASEDSRCLIIDGVLNSFAIGSSATEYTIPDGVTSIGGWAFYECSNLTSVTIPDSVTTIGEDAFDECYDLTSVTIPDSVTTIGEYAFSDCSSLTSVTIPDSVTTIGEGAFDGCDSLTSVTISDSVTTSGALAFEWCESLTSVYCKAVVPPSVTLKLCYEEESEVWYWDAFYNNASGRKIYVPTESVEAYKSAEWWSDYASDIVGYNF